MSTPTLHLSKSMSVCSSTRMQTSMQPSSSGACTYIRKGAAATYLSEVCSLHEVCDVIGHMPQFWCTSGGALFWGQEKVQSQHQHCGCRPCRETHSAAVLRPFQCAASERQPAVPSSPTELHRFCTMSPPAGTVSPSSMTPKQLRLLPPAVPCWLPPGHVPPSVCAVLNLQCWHADMCVSGATLLSAVGLSLPNCWRSSRAEVPACRPTLCGH